jgi:probable rRNA maturation factor
MSGITLVIEDQKWRSHRGLQTRLKNAADQARKAVKMRAGFTILLTDDKRLKAFNRDFRGKDKPTNVLSFPAAPAKDRAAARSLSCLSAYCGDIAIAYGVTQKQARAQAKSFADHAVHLVVHGVLHLAGYDHERLQDARRMEPLELQILTGLGIADPYLVPPP